MKTPHRFALLWAALMLPLHALGTEAAKSPVGRDDRGALAIVGTDVVAVDTGELARNQTVLVEHGRIVHVGPADQAEIPKRFDRVDGHGKFLAPGLADMHAHVVDPSELRLYLASGVTFLRVMWGHPIVLELRQSVTSGAIPGPEIYTSGPVTDGEPRMHYGTAGVSTPEQARAAVRAQIDAGYDFIKVYSRLNRSSFDAIAAAAKQQGVRFAGHVPDSVPLEHAMRSGMASMEHLMGIAEATLADGAASTNFRWYVPGFTEFATKVGRGDLRLEEIFDERKLRRVAQLAAETGIWNVPTLVTLRGHLLTKQEKEQRWRSQTVRYLPPGVKSFWRTLDAMMAEPVGDYAAGLEKLRAVDLARIKALHAAGAGLLAGTDAANPYVLWGSGVVDELELFVEAGLTPLEALRTATTNAAEYLGRTGEMGIVRTGARADLVLLGANPLVDVAAYREVAGVMAAGKWFGRAELDTFLATAARRNAEREGTFANAPHWPLAAGDSRFTAAFVGHVGDAPVRAERIGFAYRDDTIMPPERIGFSPPPEGERVVMAQELTADGRSAFHRLRVGPGDSVDEYRVTRTGAGRELEITVVRMGDEIRLSGPDGLSTTVQAEREDPVLSGTLADWLVLHGRIADMADEETRQFGAWYVNDDNRLEKRTLQVTRRPDHVIVGHFYLAGANPHDVLVRGPNGSMSMTVWIGGGFYSAWPLRAELTPGEPQRAPLLLSRYE